MHYLNSWDLPKKISLFSLVNYKNKNKAHNYFFNIFITIL